MTAHESKARMGRREALAAVGALGAAGLGAVLVDKQPAYADSTGSDVLHLGEPNTAGGATGLSSQSPSATLDLANGAGGAALLVGSGFVQLSEVPTRGFVDAGSELFDVRAYGPLTPDASAALKAALQAAASSGGGVVYLPPGRYQISQPINVPAAVTLRGAGRAATVLTTPATVLDSVLVITDSSDVAIENLSIDMTGAKIDNNSQGIAINIRADAKDVLRTMIRNVGITKAPLYALQAITSSHEAPTNNTLRLELDLIDVLASQSGNRGISVSNASSLRCRGVRANHNATTGLVLDGCTDVEIVGCEAQFNGNHGISTSSSPGTSRLAVVGNNCSFNGTLKVGLGDGIVMSNSAAEFAVVGNICCNNYGINLDIDVTTQDHSQLVQSYAVVSGNVCNGSVSLHGLSVNHAVGVMIGGNTVAGNSKHGMTLPNSQSLNVVGNVIGNNSAGGISVNQSPTPPSGLGGHVIGPNTYFGNGGTGDVWVAPGIPYNRMDSDQLVLTGPGKVTAAPGSAAGTGAPAPLATSASNGVRGSISFGSGSGPQVGEQVVITYPQSLPAPGFVQLTPGNEATAHLLPYVATPTQTGFSIAVASLPSADQPAQTYTLSYQVIG